MLAYILCEVDTICIVLLRVSYWTFLPIFIEFSLYLTDIEQKNKLARFLRHGVEIHKCKKNILLKTDALRTAPTNTTADALNVTIQARFYSNSLKDSYN